MTNDALLSHLTLAMADLPEPLPATTLAAMAKHWDMVCLWNLNVNVTSIDDPATAAWLHYRDALTALPWFTDGLTLDVGSGGGFPGIPLALARPGRPFLLMEPRRKRATLLSQAAARLQLATVDVYNGRLADAPTARCAQVVTRATFSNLGDLAPAAAWLRPGGRLIAYRSGASTLPEDQLSILATHGLSYETGHAYTLLTHERRLDVWILRPEVGDNKNEQARA
jgi:16S rRNA (guanine527-N7)-methyltransferase